jgi:hypothetical protein
MVLNPNKTHTLKNDDIPLLCGWACHSFNFLMLFVLCIVFSSCKTVKQPANTPVRTEVKQDIDTIISIEEIPILAWIGVQIHTIERYRELKEAGIDINLSYNVNIKDVAKALDAAEMAGVRMVIHCPELEKEPEKVANRFKNHPALAGYHLIDEPNRNDFSRLGELARRIQAVDNQHFCYVNLYPNYALPKQLGASTYREYVQLFLKEIPVPLLSFDHYPVRVNASGVRSLNTGWYENLEIISDEARKAGIPFWAFALTTSHEPYPIPTLADLKLQVYSNFAYGAQGVQYFTYWTPQPGTWDFHDGPIDYYTQQKTATWYTVQQMSKEIKALSNVFLGAQVIKVEHIATNALGGNATIPNGTTRFNFANRPSEANIIKTFTTSNDTNAVVSFLKNGNRCYMIIINCNLEGGDNMSVIITGGAGLQLVQKDGVAVPVPMIGNSQTVTPGDVLIYGWDK